MRRIVVAIVTGLVVLGLANAHGQTPAAPAAEQAPVDQRQTLSSQNVVAATQRTIEVTAKGPKDPAFRDENRPFLLAPWICLAGATSEELEKGFAGLLKDRAKREECQRRLTAVKAGASGPDTKVRVTTTDIELLALQAFDPVTGEPCGDPVVDISPGNQKELDLGELKCGPTDRVDLAIVKASAVVAAAAAVNQNRGAAPADPSADRRRQGRELAGQVLAVFTVSFALPSQLRAAVGRDLGAPCPARRFEIDLDATGVESSRFRNARRPLYLDPDGTGTPDDPYECAEIEFENQIVTRQLVVTFSGLDPAARPALTGVRGVSIQCQDGKCTASIRIGPASPVQIPLQALYKGYVTGAGLTRKAEAVAFAVSFYDDDREPAFPRGYFSLVQEQYLVERKTNGTWASAASLEVGSAPDLTEFDSKYSPPSTAVEPWRIRANDWRTQGNVRVSLKQNLGSRVTTDFEMRLKGGELGDPDPTVSTTRFRIDVHSLTGAVVSAGRAPVAAPSESIAIAEAGDSVGFRAGHFQINHIFRKQVRDAVLPVVDAGALRSDREHHTTVTQLTGLGLGDAALDLYFSYGQRSQARDPREPNKVSSERIDAVEANRSYSTYGGELSWAFAPKFRWTGAGYRSQAWLDRPERASPHPNDEGRGWSALTTLSTTNFDDDSTPAKRFVDWTLQVRYGLGAEEEDNPNAPNRQEAYVGESASFAPDVIFLRSLVPAVHLSDAARPALGRRGALTAGLGNKHYAGMVLNVPRLEGLGSLLSRALGDDAVGDTTGSIRAHAYWARDTGRHLGREIDLNLALEAPKGVRTSLTGAVFWPGAGLSDAAIARSTGRLFQQTRLWSVVVLVTASVP